MGSAVAPPLPTRTSPRSALRSRHVDAGASWVLELSGEADIATSGLLREELAHLLTMKREHVVVDLTSLAFCDVACAHLILTARSILPCSVTGATGSVKRVFDLVDALRVPRHL